MAGTVGITSTEGYMDPYEHREAVIHSAAIRAAIYAARGLGPATGSSLSSWDRTQAPSGAPVLAARPGRHHADPAGLVFFGSDETDGDGSDLD